MRWAKPNKVPVNNNLTIFDQAEQLKQHGMEAAYQYANVDWKKIAGDAVRECALKLPEFTSDDVWTIINAKGITTSENRAMGTVMQAASRSGMLKKTGNYISSTKKSQHKQPIALWQSLIYQPTRRQP